jgi:hypothetical protein
MENKMKEKKTNLKLDSLTINIKIESKDVKIGRGGGGYTKKMDVVQIIVTIILIPFLSDLLLVYLVLLLLSFLLS